MSTPLTRCMVSRAANNPAALERLHEAIKLNLKAGSMLIMPCVCNPRCRDLTEAESDTIIAKLEYLESMDEENDDEQSTEQSASDRN